jgi:hypothetical protein
MLFLMVRLRMMIKYIRQHFLGGSSIVFDYHLPVRASIKQLLKLPYQNYQFKSKVPFDLIDINIFNV